MREDRATSTPVVELTEAAAEKLKGLLEENQLADAAVRFFITEEQGQAAHGMAIEQQIREDDAVAQQHGLTTVVDPGNARLLQGTRIDYSNELQPPSFVVNNPNAGF